MQPAVAGPDSNCANGKFDAQGVLAGSPHASQCIGYLTKYLTKHLGDRRPGRLVINPEGRGGRRGLLRISGRGLLAVANDVDHFWRRRGDWRRLLSQSCRLPAVAMKLGAGGERVRLASERGELLAEFGEVDTLGVGAAD